MRVTEHIWRTSGGAFVPPGDPAAEFLAYAPGSEVADAEAQRVGLTDYLSKRRAKAFDKARALPNDKSVPGTVKR